jgi:hypothetical protein
MYVVFAETAPLITYYTPALDNVKADYFIRKGTGCIPDLRYTSAPLLCSLFFLYVSVAECCNGNREKSSDHAHFFDI